MRHPWFLNLFIFLLLSVGGFPKYFLKTFSSSTFCFYSMNENVLRELETSDSIESHTKIDKI